MRTTKLVLLFAFVVFGVLAATEPAPRYLEELRIGGGYGDAEDGGADFEKDGDIVTDGTLFSGAGVVDTSNAVLWLRATGSGNRSVYINPTSSDGGLVQVGLFRQDVTSGLRRFVIFPGDGSGTLNVSINAESGDLTTVGDGTFEGGDVTAGVDGDTRGVVTAWDGAGGNTPGVVKLGSPGGNIFYLFVDDSGRLRINNAMPASSTDGVVVGGQL